MLYILKEVCMASRWPSDRISSKGCVEFTLAAIAAPAGVLLLRRAGVQYLQPFSAWGPPFVGGLIALVAAGTAAFRIVRQREYPWLVALAAIALLMFDPTLAPYDPGFRLAVAVRDLLLVAAVAAFLVRALREADELERRIHFQALAFSWAAAVIVLVLSAEAADVVRLRGTWIASAMLATWFACWLVASIRYQR
jgi:hypothetical protein